MINEKHFKLFMADVVFKQGFLVNRYALEDFLECLMNLPKHALKNQIKDIKCEYYLRKDKEKEKDKRCDMIIYFGDIELNLEFYTTFKKRHLRKSVSYECRLFTNQDLKNPLKSIQYNIVSNNSILPKDNLITEYNLINNLNQDNKIFTDYYKVICINIDLVDKIEYNLDDRTKKWFKFLKADNFDEMEKISEGDVILMKLFKWFKRYTNEEETTSYYQKWAEENMYLDGLDAGKEEGKIEGKTEGREENKKEVALNMIKDNVDDNTITKYTGLTKEKIKELKATLLKL